MPAKMISETPLPMPCSVINWPNHTPIIVPAVMPMINVTVGRKSPPVKPQLGSTEMEEPLWLASSVPWAIAWSTASGIVSHSVYWLILERPDSPSLLSSSNAGIIGISNCKIIEAVMYGYTPRAITPMRDRPPPLKKFSRLSRMF
jgi:hypothetical protein